MLDDIVTGKDYKEYEEMFSSQSCRSHFHLLRKVQAHFAIVSLYGLTKLIFGETVHIDNLGLFLVSWV